MVAQFKNIVLVPTDFSEVCTNAAYQAIEVAKLLDCKVVLLHVINSQTLAYLQAENLPKASIDFKLKVLADNLMDHSSVPVEYLSREGSIFTTISEVATQIGANMVYLGTHGKLGIQRFIGSFALKVVQSSPVPVVVVQKRPFDKGYRDIILPVTSEVGHEEKAQWAVYIARLFNASVHMLVNGDASDGVKGSAHHMAEFFLTNHVSYSYKESNKTTHFARQTIAYANSNNADLILIMTEPDKRFIHFLLNGFDEELIFNTSQIPVMCVNPRKFNDELVV